MRLINQFGRNEIITQVYIALYSEVQHKDEPMEVFIASNTQLFWCLYPKDIALPAGLLPTTIG